MVHRFVDAQTLATHVATHKVGEGEHMCGVCGYTTLKQSALVDHVASHDQNTNVIVKCSSCGEELKSKRLYQVCCFYHRASIYQLSANLLIFNNDNISIQVAHQKPFGYWQEVSRLDRQLAIGIKLHLSIRILTILGARKVRNNLVFPDHVK